MLKHRNLPMMLCCGGSWKIGFPLDWNFLASPLLNGSITTLRLQITLPLSTSPRNSEQLNACDVIQTRLPRAHFPRSLLSLTVTTQTLVSHATRRVTVAWFRIFSQLSRNTFHTAWRTSVIFLQRTNNIIIEFQRMIIVIDMESVNKKVLALSVRWKISFFF